MPLKYSYRESLLGKHPFGKKLYDMLESLQTEIDSKTVAKPLHKRDVQLNKKNLKKAFGNPKSFDGLGVVHNSEGTYLIVADEQGHWFYYSLDEV